MDNPQINNITVALAMTGDEQGMIQYAMHYAEIFNASLTVIHLQDPHAGGMSMMMDAPEKFSEEDISNLLAECGINDAHSVSIQVVESESPSQAIGEAEKDTDLLVLGHRQMSIFKSNFMDSVDEGIVNNVTCPVLVVPKRA